MRSVCVARPSACKGLCCCIDSADLGRAVCSAVARLLQAEQARLAAEARDQELLKDLEPILYPSKTMLDAGAEEPSQKIGDYSLTRSEHETGRVFSSVKDLGTPRGAAAGEEVWIRGRVHQVRGKGGSAFLVVRQDTASTVQAVHFKDKDNPESSKR